MSWMDGKHNARVKSVSIDDADRGLLTAWLHLEYDSAGQSFGGYALYLPESSTKQSVAGHFIWRCMEIGEVTAWEKLPGKTIRVDIQDGLIKGIGHILRDDWFYPAEDFK